MNQRPCVNGILAAVLSASFLPIHGALAKEDSSANAPGAAKHAAKHAAKKPAKPPAQKQDANKPTPDDEGGAGDKP
ncbi:MAG: hypothetical protein WA156_16645 [Methylocystis silviterrae]